MVSAFLVGGRFPDIQEFLFKYAKYSDKDCVELQGCLFADCQEWHFQAAKYFNMLSAVHK